jgi:hypothetical protein
MHTLPLFCFGHLWCMTCHACVRTAELKFCNSFSSNFDNFVSKAWCYHMRLYFILLLLLLCPPKLRAAHCSRWTVAQVTHHSTPAPQPTTNVTPAAPLCQPAILARKSRVQPIALAGPFSLARSQHAHSIASSTSRFAPLSLHRFTSSVP